MIVPEIDLRKLHGAARLQGNRPTCLAFALSDINGHRNACDDLLSPEYLYREAARLMKGWKPHGGLDVYAAVEAVRMLGQPTDESCPYLDKEPTLPLAANQIYGPLYVGNYPVQLPSFDKIVRSLRAGKSVGMVVRLTSDFLLVDGQTARIEFSNNVMTGMSHAVVAVGLGWYTDTNEPHLLIRNSWGVDWGYEGHAWLPQNYVNVHAVCTFGE